MNRMEIVAVTFGDYITFEQWLFRLEAPGPMTASIFCKENSGSYFYNTEKVNGKWLFVTSDFN